MWTTFRATMLGAPNMRRPDRIVATISATNSSTFTCTDQTGAVKVPAMTTHTPHPPTDPDRANDAWEDELESRHDARYVIDDTLPPRATFTFAADTTDGTQLARRIDAYMPHGWYVELANDGRTITIHGIDHAGWTLTDYVLPRLASGCIYPTAITPTTPTTEATR